MFFSLLQFHGRKKKAAVPKSWKHRRFAEKKESQHPVVLSLCPFKAWMWERWLNGTMPMTIFIIFEKKTQQASFLKNSGHCQRDVCKKGKQKDEKRMQIPATGTRHRVKSSKNWGAWNHYIFGRSMINKRPKRPATCMKQTKQTR